MPYGDKPDVCMLNSELFISLDGLIGCDSNGCVLLFNPILESWSSGPDQR
jgi:hypothetical protein